MGVWVTWPRRGAESWGCQVQCLEKVVCAWYVQVEESGCWVHCYMMGVCITQNLMKVPGCTSSCACLPQCGSSWVAFLEHWGEELVSGCQEPGEGRGGSREVPLLMGMFSFWTVSVLRCCSSFKDRSWVKSTCHLLYFLHLGTFFKKVKKV